MTGPEQPDAYRPRTGPGQPSKLTPEVSARIVEIVKAGNYLTVAAQFAGISNSTLKSWLARGRRAAAAHDDGQEVPPEEQRYLTFLAAVTQAEVHAEVLAATAFRSFVTTDYRAARDFLRYRVPDRWRAVTTVNLRPEEAEQRIEHAVTEALTALGVDTGRTPDTPDLDEPGPADLLAELMGEEDPDDA